MKLQWGRSGEGAEDLGPEGRGGERLQWGRSGEGAEDGAERPDGRTTGFNGAAPVRERKTGRLDRRPGRGRFNGAAPVRERKTIRRSARTPSGRFNGAAPVRERKTRGASMAGDGNASMGPLR